MARVRGKRNAAREKAWPGERADKLRDAKRDFARFSHGGIVDWNAVEVEANKLLPGMGTIEWKERIASQSFSISSCRRFTPPKLLKRNQRHIDRIDRDLARLKGRITLVDPPPLSGIPIQHLPIKHPATICDRCGGPRGGPKGGYLQNPYGTQEKHYCRACYRINSAERRERKLQEIQIRRGELAHQVQAKVTFLLDQKDKAMVTRFSARKQACVSQEAAEGYGFWLEEFLQCGPKEMPGFDGQHWESLVAAQKMKNGTSHMWVRYCPDFTEAVIDAIEEAELAIGQPVAAWSSWKTYTDLFATEENKKRLHSAHDSYEHMASGTAKERVRHERPHWKMLRGQWA